MRTSTVVVLAALFSVTGCNCQSRVSRLSSELLADPAAVDYATVAPSSTSMKSVLIRNVGNSPIVIHNQTIEGDNASSFVTMSPPVGKLGIGEDATVWLVFTAPAQPNKQVRAELVFESDAVNGRLTVALSGASGDAVPDAGSPDGGGLITETRGTPDSGCQPQTCAQARAQCGTVSDGCGGQLSCGACTMPELCGGAGVPNVCGEPGSCPSVAAPSLAGPSSSCMLPMPPAKGIPCEIPTPGTQFYLSESLGNDSNDGRTPTTPWKTLCKAIGSATPGSTVRVASGMYLAKDVVLSQPLTLKGGYDTTFATWDPDVHHSIIAGGVNLSHDDAVLGGFRIIRHTKEHGAVFISAGKLVRNYIEMLLEPVPLGVVEGNWHTNYGVVAAAATGKHVTVACNDIYGRSLPAPERDMRLLDLIELGNVALHNGDTVIDSNRVCLDAFQGSYASAVVGGYGSCDSNTTASVTVTNNILEGRTAGTAGLSFYGCENDLLVVATNNTVLSSRFGVLNSTGVAPTYWRVTNNVFAGLSGADKAFVVQGPTGGLVSVEGNLVFGYTPNAPSPLPSVISSNDLSGVASLATTFVDPAKGDFRPLPNGPAASGGINVWGNSVYGGVTSDLRQQARPDAGTWARGALLP